ncbi:vitronectin isoform X1 [Phyllostomus discolor]|uniref:Vitronectin isoform X1 n=1 Tax=Phyllostomus discolor TaxID=89673 RepID=A0A7E6ECY7_9CHIR|nr:vitronectin isoform X1 [Phyllostomus discolor]
MAPPRPLLMLALLAWVVVADQESCKDRCTEGFNVDRKCQCDELCSYYQSCCADYMAECKPQVTRGDVFTLPEDDYGVHDYTEGTDVSVHMQSERVNPSSDLQSEFELTQEEAPVQNPEEEVPRPEQEASGPTTTDPEELCSGKPFDAFTDLKNGSIFAFRGRYCYELDEEAVKPGYPKLIRDVWGIEGPIDAAFTRINCQGKTYLFKGSQYWRFEDGVLDPGYPHSISEGFQGIPDNVDAALALPAHSYSGRERVYFFKGKQYWEYEFQQQPSRKECEGSALSTVFEHFALLQRDSWEDIFELLFWGRSPGMEGGAKEPGFISQDWPGVPEQVDAAMAGRIYISGSALRSSGLKSAKTKSRSHSRSRSRKRYGSRRGRSRGRSQNPTRKSRSSWPSLLSSEDSDLGTYTYNYDYDTDLLVPSSCEPTQSVYFFSGDEYYRVNLRTRRVDTVSPPYPRNIAQYWLGCPAPGQK